MRAQRKGVTSLVRSKKALLQFSLIVGAAAMICFGPLRGEADTVLSKAIKLCLECIGIG